MYKEKTRRTFTLLAGTLLAGSVGFAGGGSGSGGSGGSGGGGGGTVNPPGFLSLAITNEVTQAGGVAQVKVTLTQPQPVIRSGFSGDFGDFFFDGIFGVSGGGGTTGIVRYSNGRLQVSLSNPSGTDGLSGYPLLTLTTKVKAGLPVGTTVPVTMDLGSTFIQPDGTPYTVEVKPGSVKVGGSMNVSNVLPGGGTIRAGQQYLITGAGFQNGIKARAEHAKQVAANATQILMQANVDFQATGEQYVVQNGDKFQETYYSYLRAAHGAVSTDPALAGMEAVFSNAASKIASVPVSATAGIVTAVAIHNLEDRTVSNAVEALSALGDVLASGVVTLGANEMSLRSAAEWLGGSVPPAATALRVSGERMRVVGAHVDAISGAASIPVVTILTPAAF